MCYKEMEEYALRPPSEGKVKFYQKSLLHA